MENSYFAWEYFAEGHEFFKPSLLIIRFFFSFINDNIITIVSHSTYMYPWVKQELYINMLGDCIAPINSGIWPSLVFGEWAIWPFPDWSGELKVSSSTLILCTIWYLTFGSIDAIFLIVIWRSLKANWHFASQNGLYLIDREFKSYPKFFKVMCERYKLVLHCWKLG